MVINKIKKTDVLILGIPLILIGCILILALSSFPHQYPGFAVGISLDLTLTVPLVYFLLIRKRKIPKITVLPVFVSGIILSSFLVPEEHQYYLNFLKLYIIPVIELTVLFLVITKIRQTNKAFKRHSGEIDDFYLVLKKSTADVLGNTLVAKLVATEISFFYYAFFSWKRKYPTENEFTNYKDNGKLPVLWAFLSVAIIETVVLHLLIMRWSNLAAWIVTGLSIYTVLMIFGHIKALPQRFSVILNKTLLLKNGLMSTASIPLDNIKQVELCTGEIPSPELQTGCLDISKKSTDHNIAIYFHKKIRLEKAYGMTQECEVLLAQIDNKELFMEKLNTAINKGA